jgi:beta-lactamase regulating signal transducer with metallopeptidase domain
MLYWFHPVVHWMAYRASVERELACDQIAILHSGATPASYARTLISAAGRISNSPALRSTGAATLGGYS